VSVNRCVCYARSFAELKRLCDKRGWTRVEEIAEHTGCSTGCGSCRPYIAAMLSTGATHFRVLRDGGVPEACEPDEWER